MRVAPFAFSLTILACLPAALSVAEDRDEVLEIKGWGKFIDPDGDCKFSVENGGLTIAIPGTVHALSAERGRVNAPRVLRDVEGDFIAEVKVSGVTPPGSASEVRGRRPFRGAGLLLWRDEGTYVRLERAGMFFEGKDLTFASFESRRDRRFERVGDASEHPLGGEATFLRLERRGGTVIGSVSRDGTHWTTLEPLTVDLPGRVRIGIAATHNTSAPFEPRFDGLRLYREDRDGR